MQYRHSHRCVTDVMHIEFIACTNFQLQSPVGLFHNITWQYIQKYTTIIKNTIQFNTIHNNTCIWYTVFSFSHPHTHTHTHTNTHPLKIDSPFPSSIYHKLECGFTIAFVFEALLKLLTYGFRGYFTRNIHVFEFFLVVTTSIHVHPTLWRTHMAYFQVMRVVRLSRASPMLEEFTYKVGGIRWLDNGPFHGSISHLPLGRSINTKYVNFSALK